MPCSGAYLVSDLPVGPPCLIACRRCDRRGSYPVPRLAERYGWAAPLPDVLVRVSADCPRRGDFSNPCGFVYAEPLGMTPAEIRRLQAEIAGTLPSGSRSP